MDELRRPTPGADLRVMAEVELASGRRLHSSYRRAWVVPAQVKTIKPGATLAGYQSVNRTGRINSRIVRAKASKKR